MPRRRVAITGIGLISPIGLDVQQNLQSLRDASSGIRLVQAPPIRKEFAAGAVPERFESHFTKLELPFLDRCQQLAILGARQASDAAGIGDYAAYGQRAGVYYSNINGGTAAIMGWFDDLLLKGKQASRPFTAMAIMGNAGGAQVAIRQQVLGPVLSYNSACASSGVARGALRPVDRTGRACPFGGPSGVGVPALPRTPLRRRGSGLSQSA